MLRFATYKYGEMLVVSRMYRYPGGQEEPERPGVVLLLAERDGAPVATCLATRLAALASAVHKGKYAPIFRPVYVCIYEVYLNHIYFGRAGRRGRG
jgi:hypothetical protein